MKLADGSLLLIPASSDPVELGRQIITNEDKLDLLFQKVGQYRECLDKGPHVLAPIE